MATARILVVDDDHLIRQMARDLLEIASYFVEEAVDGADGLRQAAAFHPDVILLDLMLPDLDGYTVCRTLKADPATRAIPVIFLTASADPDLNSQTTAAGAAACLVKPVELNRLLAVIETTLEEVARREKRNGVEGGEEEVNAMYPTFDAPPSRAVQQATERVLAALGDLDPGGQLTVAARVTVAILTAVRPRFETAGQKAFDLLCNETLAWLRREIEALRFEKAH
jgi:CheY-like chemotaxis protein